MAKVNIDLEKLLCALMKRYYLIHNIDRSQVKCWLDDVLEDCGIEYKDGNLHYIGEEEVKKSVKEVCEDIVGESEPFTIKRGKWYKLIKPIGGFSTIGKIYYACYDGRLLVDNGMVCNVEEVSDHFQLVTQAEIKEVEKPDTIKFEEEPKKKVHLEDLDVDDDELRTAVKKFICEQNKSMALDKSFWGKETIEQLHKETDEGSKEINEVLHKAMFYKEPDFDGIVEEYKQTIGYNTLIKWAPHLRSVVDSKVEAYKDGLKDMWKHLKGE